MGNTDVPDISLERIVNCLDRAVTAGLLVRTTNSPLSPYGTHKDGDFDGTKETDNPSQIEYRFTHDRIQEAAQSLVMGDQRNELCDQIARKLESLSSTHHGEDWMLFAAAHHMNGLPEKYTHGYDDARIFFAAVNLRAALLAIHRSAFRQAAELLRSGMTYLNRKLEKHTKWQKHYNLCLNMTNRLLEAEFTVGNHEASQIQILVDEVMTHAKSERDKLWAQYHDVEISTSCKDRNFEGAVENGVQYLAKHGIHLPLRPSKTSLSYERISLQLLQRRRNLIDVLELPLMNDHYEKIMKLLTQLQTSAVIVKKNRLITLATLTAQRLTWEKGVSVLLPSMLANYASLLRQQGKFREAISVASDAEEMTRKLCVGPAWVLGTFFTRGPVLTLREGYSNSTDIFSEVHRVGVSCGSCQWGILGAMLYCLCVFAAGLPVNALLVSKMTLFEEEGLSFGLSPAIIVTFRIFRQTVLNLQGKGNANPMLLKGKAVDQEEALMQFEGNTRQQTLRDFSLCRLFLACVYGDETTMLEMVDLLSTYPVFDLPQARQHLRDSFLGLAVFYLLRKGAVQGFEKQRTQKFFPIHHFFRPITFRLRRNPKPFCLRHEKPFQEPFQLCAISFLLHPPSQYKFIYNASQTNRCWQSLSKTITFVGTPRHSLVTTRPKPSQLDEKVSIS
jgi:hypothetical protein